jgi:methionyl-tRNA formyltransferase
VCCDSRHAGVGQVVGVDSGHGILVSCGDGSVWLRVLQAPGKKPVAGADFARGHRVGIGDRFGHDEMESTEG